MVPAHLRRDPRTTENIQEHTTNHVNEDDDDFGYFMLFIDKESLSRTTEIIQEHTSNHDNEDVDDVNHFWDFMIFS